MVVRSRHLRAQRRVEGVRRVPARTPWGNLVGSSRAVRKGSIIAVSGTTATDARGRIIGRNDPYKQTIFIVKKIQAALNELGGSLDDIVRTRIYTTDISLWREIARAHRQFLGRQKPACTMVQVSKLIDSDILVEMEVEAVC